MTKYKMKLIRTIQNTKNKENDTNQPKIAILGCVHGNENYSLKVFKQLKKINLKSGIIDFYLVNQKAHQKKVRFIDQDLNRSFNSTENNLEITLAKQIKQKLNNYEYIIDIHSTTSKTPPFLIYTNEELENSHFLNSFNIKRKVYIKNAKFSLIGQFQNAIAIEISLKNGNKIAMKNAKKYILSFLANNNLINKPKNKINYTETYTNIGKTKKNNKLKDFKLTKITGEQYYPMLSGKTKYKNLYCFKLKRKYNLLSN